MSATTGERTSLFDGVGARLAAAARVAKVSDDTLERLRLPAVRRTEPYVKQVTGIQSLDVHGYLRLRVPYRDLATQRLIGAGEEQRLTAVIQTQEQFDQLKALLGEYRDALIAPHIECVALLERRA